MSTKNTTTSTNQYNSASMSTYNSLQGGLGNALSGYMNNPFGNPFFQTQQQMGNNQANMIGQSNISNLTRNLNLSGISQSSPAALEMMNNMMRGNSNTRATLGFLNPVQNAFTAQQNAMGMANSYRPLQTGGTQTQTQSGLGTWLPQLIGGGLSMLTGGLLGRGSSAAGGPLGGIMSGTMGAMNSALSPMSPGSSFFQGPQSPMGMGAPDAGGYNFGSSPFTMGQPGGY